MSPMVVRSLLNQPLLPNPEEGEGEEAPVRTPTVEEERHQENEVVKIS